jgi:Polyketide cyclase / dehydrase and lipid transport
MAHEFSGSTVINRPITEVFEFLADGTNDPKFSPRVQEIRKATDGPVGVGTVFDSTVKDAGMKTGRSFELTAFEAPRKIRWAERSKNMVTVPDGGYDLEEVSKHQTKVTIRNTFEGHGFGKLVVGFAARGRHQGRTCVRAAHQVSGRGVLTPSDRGQIRVPIRAHADARLADLDGAFRSPDPSAS